MSIQIAFLLLSACSGRRRSVLPFPQLAFRAPGPRRFSMNGYSRRDFLKTGIAAGTVASVGTPLLAEKRTALDKVTLGKSGVQVTRLAFGTGSNNGHVQYSLGQKDFSKLVAYAY